MVRQSISITTPNDKWLNSLIASEEYSSKSEVLNDLMRKAREQQNGIEYIREYLIAGENSGICNQTPDEIISEFKAELRACS